MLRWFERLLNPFPAREITPPANALWPFLWQCTQGSRGLILVMTLFTAMLGGFEAFLFAVMGKVVDWLSITTPADLWTNEGHHLFLLAGLLLLSPVIIGVQTLIKHQTLAGNFPMLLRWNFHRLMLSQSMSFYQDEFAGRIAAKVMQTALAVRDVWFIVADIMVFVVIYFVTMVAVVGHFNLLVMLPFIAWVICYVASLSYFVPRLAKVSQNQADARALMTGRITDAYTNISTVKLFSHAGREAGYAQSAMHDFLGTVHRQMRYVSGVEVTNHLLNMLLVIATSGVALWLWTQDEVSVGGVAAATAMALRLNGISHWVMWELTSLYEQIGTAQDGVNTLSLTHQINDAADAKPLQVVAGEIKFAQVNFAYGMQKNVLQGLNLTIRAGEKVGLVGRSGAGKSTIVNLLLRFYDVEQGAVLIDDQDVRSVTQNSLRSQIGMVTQDTSLLHRSVRENILYGKPDATDAEMVAAAKRAEAHEFILQLRDAKGRVGYDAHVGERGVKLSGGQRQRIAIARVMLKDAPILVLDEATSALDSEVEAVIQSSLYDLMQGKTVIAIAHRLSTIAAMDRLVILDEGCIVEQGDHQTLLAKNGLYAQLWKHQSGGFLGKD
ncbi:MAG: multidrug ABC transporter ATP-binding protein [Betaproteobacteria bacterium HGW-Betaproteobacteria-22]|nr:MAG: multidrug ABC transporter ATP-binding protein [Betaproteobacteria bacterium HGW-Betaproteobacteria-22]